MNVSNSKIVQLIRSSNKVRTTINFSLIAVFIFNIRKLLFPVNFQQDDVSELSVIFLQDIKCAFFDFGDTHPLWSTFIWFTSRVFPSFEYFISVSNVIITLISLAILFKILEDEFSYTTAIFGVSLLIISPVLLTYSTMLKQYPTELLSSIIFLRIYQIEKSQERKQYSNLIILFLTSFFVIITLSNSLVISIVIFSIIFIRKGGTLKRNITSSNVFIFLAISFPIFFINIIIRKVERPNFGLYWDEFFIETSTLVEFTNSFLFLNSLLLQSLLGNIYNRLAPLAFLFCIAYALYKRKEVTNLSVGIIATLYFLSSLEIYPLGAGRTDILFLPFLIIVIANVFNLLHNYIPSQYQSAIPMALLILLSSYSFFQLEVNYKTENVEVAIEKIVGDTSKNKTIIVTEDLSPGFLYYASGYFDKKIDESLECPVEKLLINRYYSYEKSFGQSSDISTYELTKNIWLLGIELEGTTGRFRDVETYLIEKDYKAVETIKIPNGLYLINFSN